MQIFKILLISVALGIALIVGVSQTDAIQENITFEELEILPSPNRENLYTYIFNVCIGETSIEDPKIMVISDMERKGLQLTQVFNSDQCFGAVENIRAKDPDSIRTELVTYEIHANVEDKRNQIEILKTNQERLQIQLRDEISNKFPEGSVTEHREKIREISDALGNTNQRLQDLTAQFYAMQEFHHPDEFDK